MVDLDRAGSGAAELASRQAKLQKALSTAYLNHQIAELETKVKAAKITPTPKPAPHVQQDNGDMSDVMVPPRDPNDDLGRADDVEDPDDQDGSIWRVVVVDVSALMWAKNAVKRLVQKGWEVIVPLEAIRTLDLLKKGSSASAIAARQAARYIEHASRFHQPISSNPTYSIQRGTNYRKGRGLRIQREDEVRAVDTLLDELALPPMDGDSSLPSWVQSVFTCVAFFKWIGDVDAEGDGGVELTHGYDMLGPVLFVANPPVFVEVSQGRSQPTPSARDDDARDIDYTARGEGHVILQEAARFDLSLEVLRDDDVEVEESNLGRGRGKGGKGRGREGRGKKGDRGRDNRRGDGKRQQISEPEPQREIKILLRREMPSGQGGEGDFPSPESRESTLQSATISPALPPPQLQSRSKTDDFPPPAQASPFVMGMQGRPPPFFHHERGRGLGRGRGHHGWGFRPPPPLTDIDGFPALGLPPPPLPPPALPSVPTEHMRPPPPPGPPHHKGFNPRIHDIPAPPPPPVMQAHPRFDHDRRGPSSPQLFDAEVTDGRGSRHSDRGHGYRREHSLEREHSHHHEHYHRGGEGRGRGRGGGEGRGGGRGGGRGRGHSHGREGGGVGGGGFTLLQRPDRPSARDQQSVLLASTATLARKDDLIERKERDRQSIRSREREEPKVVLLQRPR